MFNAFHYIAYRTYSGSASSIFLLDHTMSVVELEIAAHSSKNNKIKQLQYLTIVSYHKVEIKLNYLSTNVNIYIPLT